jgi:cytochrome P450
MQVHALCALLTEHIRSAKCALSPAISYVAEVKSSGDLSIDQIVADLVFVLVAAFETTNALIGHILWFLVRRPDISEQLFGDRTLIPKAVDELARLFPSIQLVSRKAIGECEINESKIEIGQIVLVLIAAANRDSAAFPHPDEFILSRPASPFTLSFGAGAHACIGASIGRQVGGIVLEAFLAQGMWRKTFDVPRPKWRRLAVFRAFEYLVITQDVPSRDCANE